eukprot:4163898-Alexandrium_andersonii.AAC.1
MIFATEAFSSLGFSRLLALLSENPSLSKRVLASSSCLGAFLVMGAALMGFCLAAHTFLGFCRGMAGHSLKPLPDLRNKCCEPKSLWARGDEEDEGCHKDGDGWA